MNEAVIEMVQKLKIMQSNPNGDHRLLLYHSCRSGVVTDSIPFGIGFPALPRLCPICQQMVNDREEWMYDVYADDGRSRNQEIQKGE